MEGEQQKFNPEEVATQARKPFDDALTEDRGRLTVRQRAYLQERAKKVADRATQTQALTVTKPDEAQIAMIRRELEVGYLLTDNKEAWLEDLKRQAGLDPETKKAMKDLNKAWASWLDRILRRNEFYDIELANDMITEIGRELLDALHTRDVNSKELEQVTHLIKKPINRMANYILGRVKGNKSIDYGEINRALFSEEELHKDKNLKSTLKIGRGIENVARNDLGANGTEIPEFLLSWLETNLALEQIISVFNRILEKHKLPEGFQKVFLKKGVVLLKGKFVETEI